MRTHLKDIFPEARESTSRFWLKAMCSTISMLNMPGILGRHRNRKITFMHRHQTTIRSMKRREGTNGRNGRDHLRCKPWTRHELLFGSRLTCIRTEVYCRMNSTTFWTTMKAGMSTKLANTHLANPSGLPSKKSWQQSILISRQLFPNSKKLETANR